MDGGNIHVLRVFNAKAIAGSGSSASSFIDLRNYKPTKSIFGLIVTTTGAGSTFKLEVQVSVDGSNWMEPAGVTDIVAAQAVGSAAYSFPLPAEGYVPVIYAPWLRLKATENTGNNGVITADVTIQ